MRKSRHCKVLITACDIMPNMYTEGTWSGEGHVICQILFLGNDKISYPRIGLFWNVLNWVKNAWHKVTPVWLGRGHVVLRPPEMQVEPLWDSQILVRYCLLNPKSSVLATKLVYKPYSLLIKWRTFSFYQI